MEANDGQCLNLVSFSASSLECSCTDSPGRDASPSQVPSNNAGTHLQLNILRQIGVNEIA